VKAFYSDTFVLPLPEGHRFPMTKYRRLREQLIGQRVLLESEMAVPEPARWDEIRLAHTDEYVDAVANGTLTSDAQRRIGFPWSPQMVERSRRSVGATLAAGREVIVRGGHVSANLAGGTHHAFSDRGAGYCVFNDVAVTVRTLQRDGLIGRAAVVDCDVHQGDGTAAIFQNDSSVFTMSLHGSTNFPFRKEVGDLDVTFADGTGDTEYLAALASHLPRVIEETKPDIVFYLAGADPYEGDRLGKLALSIHALRKRDAFVFGQCRHRAIPVVVTMAGGYCPDVEAIVTIHVNTIKEAVRTSRCR
jgi:acetoin utilization deacetylase AcuC-like enzyme